MTSIDYGHSIEKYRWIIHVVTVLVLVLAGSFLIYGFRTDIFTSQEAMTSFLEAFGLLTPVIYILFITFQSTFMVVPGAVGNLVGVIMFGPFWGILFNYIGSVMGSTVNFSLARFYGKGGIGLLVPRSAMVKYEKWLKEDEMKFHKWFALCIFLPLAPDDLLCYLAGLTRMSYQKFLLIIFLGKPFGVTFYSLALYYGFNGLLRIFG